MSLMMLCETINCRSLIHGGGKSSLYQYQYSIENEQMKRNSQKLYKTDGSCVWFNAAK